MKVYKIEPGTLGAARAALAGLLIDTVSHGASLGFLSDLDAAEANTWLDGVEKAVADGSRLLFVAEYKGAIAGTVQLDLCLRKNGINRAEVQKLMVHSGARGHGIATALMRELEAEALKRERGLLYLDTEAGSGAERFYLAMGYTCIGGLPEYACSPDGEWRANAIYYKTLFLRNAP